MLTSQLKDNQFDLTCKWIVDSGIQAEEGGFYAWYELDKQSYPFVYSEITGYGITTLLFLNKIFNQQVYLEKAKKAASWIIESAMHPCGGVKARLYKEDISADKMYSFNGENIFSFDTAMVLYGIVNLYKHTQEENLLKAAKNMAGFLIDMQNKDGSITPLYNAKQKEKIETHDKWSNQCGSFLAKAAIGLVDLHEITGDQAYKNSAMKICEYALSRQDKSGRFITDSVLKTTNLHPHCYSIEGLLYAGVYFNAQEFIKSAKRAFVWISQHVSKEGINELYDPVIRGFNQMQRTDVLAQSLRLGLLLGTDPEIIEYLKTKLVSYQYNQEDEQIGGVFYSRNNRHLNAWCTMFGLQALALYYRRELLPETMKLDLFI